MNLGLRALLLIAAVVLFVFAAISDSNFGDLLRVGPRVSGGRTPRRRDRLRPHRRQTLEGRVQLLRPVMLYAGT